MRVFGNWLRTYPKSIIDIKKPDPNVNSLLSNSFKAGTPSAHWKLIKAKAGLADWMKRYSRNYIGTN